MQPDGAWGWNSRNLWPTYETHQRGAERDQLPKRGESSDICSERASTNAQCHVCMIGTGDERKERSNNGFPRFLPFPASSRLFPSDLPSPPKRKNIIANPYSVSHAPPQEGLRYGVLKTRFLAKKKLARLLVALLTQNLHI